MSNDPVDIQELLLPYSLGQLDDAERARVRLALDADPRLREQLAEFEELAARLVSSVEQVPAPTALKARVMDAVDAGARGGAQQQAAQAVQTAQFEQLEPVEQELPMTTVTRPSRFRRRQFAWPALAGGLAAACVALAVVSVGLDRELEQRDSRLDRIEAQLEEGEDSPFAGSETLAVSTSGKLDPATGSLVRVGDDTFVLLLRDVPSPGVGNSWQVWTADRNGIVRNAGLWQSGSVQTMVLDAADISQVMVSLEPTTRPAPVPSSDPVANVQV